MLDKILGINLFKNIIFFRKKVVGVEFVIKKLLTKVALSNQTFDILYGLNCQIFLNVFEKAIQENSWSNKLQLLLYDF